MINVVVASHGELGRVLLDTARMIVGPLEGVFAVSLRADEPPEAFAERLGAVLRQLSGQETLVLVDLLGGTPYNIAARLVLEGASSAPVACVTGVNLPLLLELLLARERASSALALAEQAAQAGQDSIRVVKSQARK